MAAADSNPEISLKAELKGHGGWVTAIATAQDPALLLTASRDKTIVLWRYSREDGTGRYLQKKRLKGHGHFVQDVALSSDGQFALSGSWDKDLRLWDLSTGLTTRRFVGHTKDVLSVAFSADNRQIVSGSRDRSIKLWNTLGHCKFTIPSTDREPRGKSAIDAHKDWVSCVRFSPNTAQPVIVSASWDKLVKVWGLENPIKLRQPLSGHNGYVNTVTVSPDGSLCASGGKDGIAFLWDLTEGRHLSSLENGDVIHALCFSPVKYWLCAATASDIQIWDLESKSCLSKLRPIFPVREKKSKKEDKVSKAVPIQCISLAWSIDGNTLFAGYTDNVVRVWQVASS